MKIGLVTYSDNIFRIVLSKFEKSKEKYCSKYQLDFHYESINFDNTFKLSWLKIDILLKYLELYDYVYVTDYDSVIINDDYDIRKLIKESNNADVICNQLDSGFKLIGCSIFKSSVKTKLFLKHILTFKDNSRSFYAEETPFNLMLEEFKIKVHIEKNINHIINIHDGKPNFMLHYASVSNPLKIKKIHAETFNYS